MTDNDIERAMAVSMSTLQTDEQNRNMLQTAVVRSIQYSQKQHNVLSAKNHNVPPERKEREKKEQPIKVRPQEGRVFNDSHRALTIESAMIQPGGIAAVAIRDENENRFPLTIRFETQGLAGTNLNVPNGSAIFSSIQRRTTSTGEAFAHQLAFIDLDGKTPHLVLTIVSRSNQCIFQVSIGNEHWMF
jgi:hypothetical protein